MQTETPAADFEQSLRHLAETLISAGITVATLVGIVGVVIVAYTAYLRVKR